MGVKIKVVPARKAKDICAIPAPERPLDALAGKVMQTSRQRTLRESSQETGTWT